ncbi:MAG: ABC transporter permease [Clostridiales bacterium]
MKEIKITIINEIDKIISKKKFYILLILSLLSIGIIQILLYFSKTFFGINSMDFEGFPKFILLIFSNTILPLIIILLTIDIFSNEFNNNTIKLSIMKPITRFELFLSKCLSIIVIMSVFIFFIMFFSILLSLIFNFSSFSINSFFRIVLAYGVIILPICVVSLIIIFISNIIESASLIFFTSVLIILILKGLGMFLPQYSNLFIISFLEWYNLWLIDYIPVFRILRSFLIMIGMGIMLYSAAYYNFDKKSF